ncbi:glycosyltransferase family 2 protein, partial [Actinoplanes philippinensis]|uniref:glycosyltransferase family 2 protein n=1 Tax=Actinoplanes philippinensis TaxID=35752 RepID=UPI0033F24ED8
MPPLSTPPRTVVLLTVYRPQPELVDLAAHLRSDMPAGTRLVVVDDGNDTTSQKTFTAVRDLGATVLRHPANLGKGAALKTGFAHIRATHPDADVVCADADGQHHTTDIRRVADRIQPGHIVLGVRRLDRMPAASRLGNTITGALFRAVTGYPVTDTQTGLRGFSAGLLDWLCTVTGDGFDYEMNTLLDAASTGRPITTVDIATRYLDGNSASNFSGVTDSMRVYRPLLRYTAASAAVATSPAACS